MNPRALKIKKQEASIAQRSVRLQLVQITNRKAILDRQINKLSSDAVVLQSLSVDETKTSRVKSLVRLLNFRSWCDGLVKQSEEHQQELEQKTLEEESRLEQAIRHLKTLKEKEGVLEEFLKKDLRFKLAECRANDESAIEELAMACIARGLA